MLMKSCVAYLGIVGPATFAAILLLAQVPGASSAMAASAEKGKIAFARHGCWQCHGYEGQGGVTGKRLAPDPLPFETLSAFVRTTSGAMPPYREQILSGEDLEDIYAYLQSIPKGVDPKNIPLLNQ
jgi:ubiquinol-cytochrome c reductase cytochrome c subunit